MSILLCKFFHRLQRHSGAVLIGALLLTLFSLFLLRNISWHPSLNALFDAPQEEFSAQDPLLFRSTAHLSLVIEGENATENRAFMRSFVDAVHQSSQIGYAVHSFDSAFVANNILFYFGLNDLEELRNALSRKAEELKRGFNAFVVDLIPAEESSPNRVALQELSEEFLPEIRSELGARNGKILLAHILPKAPIETPLQAHLLFKEVRAIADSLKPAGANLYYRGEVVQLNGMHAIHNQEMPRLILLSVVAIVLLLLLSFFRQPMVPLIALLPVVVALIWILAYSHLLIGAFTPLTMLLVAIFFALGTGLVIYLLGRYEEERLKGLGPHLSLETVLLETGPAIVLGSLITSIGFFVLMRIPFKGYSDFGRTGGIATLLMMIAVMAVFPALLQQLQRHRPFHVEGRTRRNLLPFQRARLSRRSVLIASFLLIAILSASLRFGIPFTYEKGLQGIGLITSNDEATKLIKEIDLYGESPVIVHCRDSASAAEIAQQLSRWGREKKLIHTQVFHTGQILPNNQREKLEFFEEVEELLDSNTLSKLSEEERKIALRLLQRLPRAPLTAEGAPPELSQLLSIPFQGNLVFAFIRFPLKEGMNAARVALYVDRLAAKQNARAAGAPIFLGRFVDQTLSKMPWAQVISILTMLLLLGIEIGWRRIPLEAVGPVLCGIIPALAWIFQSDAGLNPVNVLLLPFIFGLTFNNVIQVQHRYHEEGFGSLPFVLRTTGVQVALATAVILCVFLPFLLSSSELLRTIGSAMVGGAFGSLIATLLALPLFLGIKERLRRAQNALE